MLSLFVGFTLSAQVWMGLYATSVGLKRNMDEALAMASESLYATSVGLKPHLVAAGFSLRNNLRTLKGALRRKHAPRVRLHLG